MMTAKVENPKLEFPVLDDDRLVTVQAMDTAVMVTISQADGTETRTMRLPYAKPAQA
jgi:hypothetical protein